MKGSAAAISLPVRLAALAEPLRLRMLRLLERQELSVGEVARIVQLPQSTVSRQLKVLSDAGFLTRRSEGTATLYRMVMDDLPPEARSLWQPIREQLLHSPDDADDARRLEAVLAERRTDSASFFGRLGGEWDQVRRSLFGAKFTALALLGLLPRNWVIADVGCGAGDAAELLAPHAEKVIGIDNSEAMLAAAAERLSGFGNIELVKGDVSRLPLKARSVDACVSLLLLHHVDDPGAAIAQMARVLRRTRGGGVVLICDMVRHERAEYRHTMGHKHPGFSKETMLRFFQGAGLRDGQYVELPRDTEGKGPGLFTATATVRE